MFYKHAKFIGAASAACGAALLFSSTLAFAKTLSVTYVDLQPNSPNATMRTISYDLDDDRPDLVGGVTPQGPNRAEGNLAPTGQGNFNSFGLFGSKFAAWNVKEDLTGDYVRPGSDVRELEKYAQNDSVTLYLHKVSPFSLFLFSLKPNILTTIVNNNSGEIIADKDYESKANAYPLDQSESIFSRALVRSDLPENSKFLSLIWGRPGRYDLENSKGNIISLLDSRISIDRDLEIFFASTWIKPDESRLGLLGYEAEPKTITVDGKKISGFTYTITKDQFKALRVENAKRRIELPVRAVSYDELLNLTWADFNKPIYLSVADDFEKGLNSVIEASSFNNIATSDNPYITMDGSIELSIKADTLTVPLTSSANTEYLKLYTTGNLKVNKIDEQGNQLGETIISGRTFNEKIGTADEYNYQNYVSLYDKTKANDETKEKDITPDGVDVVSNRKLVRASDGKELELRYIQMPDGTKLRLSELTNDNIAALQNIALQTNAPENAPVYTFIYGEPYINGYIKLQKLNEKGELLEEKLVRGRIKNVNIPEDDEQNYSSSINLIDKTKVEADTQDVTPDGFDLISGKNYKGYRLRYIVKPDGTKIDVNSLSDEEKAELGNILLSVSTEEEAPVYQFLYEKVVEPQKQAAHLPKTSDVVLPVAAITVTAVAIVTLGFVARKRK